MYLLSDGLLILCPEKTGLYMEYLFFHYFFRRIFIFPGKPDEDGRIALLDGFHDIDAVVLAGERDFLAFPGTGPPGEIKFPFIISARQAGEGGMDIDPADVFQRLEEDMPLLQVDEIMLRQEERIRLF